MKKIKNNGIFYVVISFIAVLAVGSVMAVAYSGYGTPKVVVEGDFIEASAPAVVQPEESLGATPGNYFTGPVNFGGNIIHTISGNFINASTTIVSLASPFLTATTTAADVIISGDKSGTGFTSATTTVDLVRLNIFGVATSTFTVQCGNATTMSVASTDDIISSDTIATSTAGIIENNLASTEHGNGTGVGGGTVAKITLTPNVPFFTCVVTTSYDSAFTGTNNTFDGKYTVRFSRTE